MFYNLHMHFSVNFRFRIINYFSNYYNHASCDLSKKIASSNNYNSPDTLSAHLVRDVDVRCWSTDSRFFPCPFLHKKILTAPAFARPTAAHRKKTSCAPLGVTHRRAGAALGAFLYHDT